MRYEIEIPDHLLTEAISKIVTVLLSPPNSFSGGRTGVNEVWEIIESAVKAQLKAIDIRPMIAEMATKRLQSCVEDVVESTLKEHIRKLAKEMQRAGTLFEGKPS